MTEPELRQLALDYVAGKVYTTHDVPKELWHLVFMPLAFSTKAQLRGVRMVLAQINKDHTTAQGVNGFPIFFSCRMFKMKETRLFSQYVQEAKEVTDTFVGAKNGKRVRKSL